MTDASRFCNPSGISEPVTSKKSMRFMTAPRESSLVAPTVPSHSAAVPQLAQKIRGIRGGSTKS